MNTGAAIVGMTSTFTDCTFDNVTITGATNPIKTRQPGVNAPSYADNATALAALGEGYFYKNTTSGQYEITHL